MRTSPTPPLRRAPVGRSALAALPTPCAPAPACAPRAASVAERAGTPAADHGVGGPDGASAPERAAAPRERERLLPVPDGFGTPGPGTERVITPGGGDQLAVRIVSQRDAAWLEALFAAVDAKQ
ncbi:hypothetical protein ACFV06_33250 [Streptomyces sp. NPDC059618]|uniref:hypothetical protein n=1 Tax=Streptomyces sp. NPDC059618 TaxID=3346887 RepID=UPI00367EC81B